MGTLVMILFGLAIFFGPLILALVAITKAAKSQRHTRELDLSVAGWNREVQEIRADIRALKEQVGQSAAPAEDQGEDIAAPAPEEDAAPEQPVQMEEIADPGKAESERPAALGMIPQTAKSAPPSPPPTGGGLKKFEEVLAGRWLVWLGALAIALGGVFLVKYAIDQGLLGPATRVTLGLVLGLALISGGEFLRRRPLQRAISAMRANYVPPALAASGLFTVFASILAAYTLYGLVPPIVAFAALVGVACLAVGLSLLHGWFVALMGLLGAFATPALISIAAPSAWSLFAYLLVIQVACLAVLRYQAWWWLALATLGCAAIWPVLWLMIHWRASDTLPLGIYLLATAGVFLHFGYGRQRPAGGQSWRQEITNLQLPEAIGWIAASAVALLIFVMVRFADFSVMSLVLVGLMVALYFVVGRRDAIFDGLAVLAGAAVLAVMAVWGLPDAVTLPRPMFQFQGRAIGVEPGAPLIPPEIFTFATAGAVFGGLVGIGAFVALWGAKRPAVWAAVSAATPVLILVIAYWRFKDFGIDIRWAAVAFTLAAVALGASVRVAHYRREQNLAISLGFYAAAVVAFLSLGLTMTLQQAWLTVAFSVQLPALAWIHRRVPEKSVEAVAAIIAGVILTRLVFNYNVLDYSLAGSPLTSWVVYGYGLPALMFIWAARMFRSSREGSLVTLLEAGAMVFAALMVSLLIRLLIEGSLVSTNYGLEEQSLQSIAWLSMAYVLAVHHRRRSHIISFYASRILLGLAAAQVVLLQVLWSNPLFTQEPVGAYPVVNVLLLAYAVPAAIAFRIAADDWAPVWLPRALAVGGFGLVFAYVSLEVTRAFQGPVLNTHSTTNTEFYAYSMVWLVFAALLLALGIFRKEALLRYASLAVLWLTILKVFLFDMADLEGLLRAASFLGLGLSLVGIGYLYQRFVFGRPAQTSPPAGPEEA